MTENEYTNSIVAAMISDAAYLTSKDDMRRLFYHSGQWEVYGKNLKYQRTRLLACGLNFDECMRILLGIEVK